MTDPVSAYFHDKTEHTEIAARIILPIVFEKVDVRSVLDVGCGLGTWLSAAHHLGIEDYLGLDGSYVDKTKLTISAERFRAIDLREPFVLNRKYSLVISLEVAEHLPETSAENYVDSLIQHGDFILFSAAIPNQTGLNHLNEQWPEYWEKKFRDRGFFFHDVIRPLVWNNENIEWWYRQNIFLVSKDSRTIHPFGSLSMVHPRLFESAHLNHSLYKNGLLNGRQGIVVSFTVLYKAVLYKLKTLFGSK